MGNQNAPQLAVFTDNPIIGDNLRKYLTKDVIYIFQLSIVDGILGQRARIAMINIIPLIKNWEIRELGFADQFYDVNEVKGKVVVLIQEINFPYLQTINLVSNELESLEGLHRIHMPSLQSLHLGKFHAI